MANEDYPRSHRVADFIQRELSQLIRTEVKDPRVSPMLTIASVEVSRDLSSAKVYYTLFGDEDPKQTQQALLSVAPFLRRRLAGLMRTRTVPALRFYHDDSSARGAAMSALIASAVASNTTEEESSREGEGGTDPAPDA